MNIRIALTSACFFLAACNWGGNGGTPSEVVIHSPESGATVSSPLTVRGEARGGWFFEASLPVELQDSEGNVIVRHYGQAEGEWMTPEMVPFTSVLVFETDAQSGYLIIRKDNPSGLPENDGEYRIPVRF